MLCQITDFKHVFLLWINISGSNKNIDSVTTECVKNLHFCVETTAKFILSKKQSWDFFDWIGWRHRTHLWSAQQRKCRLDMIKPKRYLLFIVNGFNDSKTKRNSSGTTWFIITIISKNIISWVKYSILLSQTGK